ncbi:ABC transporter permease subunit [Amnibacterium sp. CER49]|uniref:ABC transporter permease n=1 Tax=Amnibacterium sp. CER49 TaxID=3039161 RepID=UPI00244A3FAF|nr:ABC transporter permease subunit [Amnibacterium sp. CER49]MDH2442836.1 ABC transporter permease subunit [Amnibacterium sp. CER49]
MTAAAVPPPLDAVPTPRVRTRARSGVLTGAVPSAVTGLAVLVVAGALFLVPLAAMAWFTVQQAGSGAITAAHYAAILDPAQASNYADLFTGLTNSLGICVLTVAIVLVLLLPAMLLAELRYPAARRVLELVCLLPISVPTVVLVVGFVPVYQVVGALVGPDAWTLALAIGVIVLPYAYRPIRANLSTFNVVVLAEAARSLGASWPATVLRVILPNLRRGLLSSCLLTISVVLGEFTIANVLSRTTFQTALLLLQQTDPYVATIFALGALLLVFLLLVVISTVGALGRSRRPRR